MYSAFPEDISYTYILVELQFTKKVLAFNPLSI